MFAWNWLSRSLVSALSVCALAIYLSLCNVSTRITICNICSGFRANRLFYQTIFFRSFLVDFFVVQSPIAKVKVGKSKIQKVLAFKCTHTIALHIYYHINREERVVYTPTHPHTHIHSMHDLYICFCIIYYYWLDLCAFAAASHSFDLFLLPI